jgi:hypothetical protein
MTTTMTTMTTTTMNLSTKFEKELAKFIAWVEKTDYKISDIVDGSNLEWKNVVLVNFEEPGRNKLETFIKELMKVYFVSKGSDEINDIKMMTKEFREYKPKPKRERFDTESEGEQKKVKKVNDQKKHKTESKNIKSKKNFDVVVNESFDTNDTWYLDTLSQSTEELVAIFGEPIKNDNPDDYQYEWKIMVGGKVFSIYNWLNYYNEFYDFEDNEWYLAGFVEKSDEEKFLMNYIKTKPLVKVGNLDEMLPFQTKEKQPELFGSEEEQEEQEEQEQELDETVSELKETTHELDIELDFIEDDDLEINIDDIDFDF